MSNNLSIDGREYKVIVSPGVFWGQRRSALNRFWQAAASLAGTFGITSAVQDLPSPDRREIVFLDTPDHDFRRRDLVLRRREKLDSKKIDFTLKCRSSDRLVPKFYNLEVSQQFSHLKIKNKFEEDMAVPLTSRFSRSTRVRFPSDDLGNFMKKPNTVGEVAKLFPILDTLGLQSGMCVDVVNGIKAYERVYEEENWKIKSELSGFKLELSAALILWTDGKDGDPMVAEFSFRFEEDKDEIIPYDIIHQLNGYFLALQHLPDVNPGGTTKTAFVYGG